MDKELDKWLTQWQNALEQGIFPEKKVEASSEESYFGFHTKPLENKQISDVDSKYWNDVSNLSRLYGSDPDVLNEYLANKLVKEEVDIDLKKYTKDMINTPNPVRPSSVTMAQDITNPISTGDTYDVSDLKSLETLKLKLADLLIKLNTSEVMNQSGTAKLETQIQSLQKQIDELSDSLGRTGIPSQVGD